MKLFAYISVRRIEGFPCFHHIFVRARDVDEAYTLGPAAMPEWEVEMRRLHDGIGDYAFEVSGSEGIPDLSLTRGKDTRWFEVKDKK